MSAAGRAGCVRRRLQHEAMHPVAHDLGLPPTSLSSTGTLAAIASSSVFDMPSLTDGRTNIVEHGQQDTS